MRRGRRWPRLLFGLVLGLTTACQGTVGGPPDGPRRDAGTDLLPDSGPGAPNRVSVGPADLDPGPGGPGGGTHGGRVIRRLTADQLNRSLTVVTGETWTDFDRYAGALGQPDLVEVTDEGLSPSVAFAKLVEDAARTTCDAAVERDLTRPAAERVILRHATPDDDDLPTLVANVRYLYLRFHALDLAADDERLAPALGLLTAAPAAGGALSRAGRIARWKALCVGLVTHPDFLTY